MRITSAALGRAFFERRLRWGPTWRGWLLLLVVGLVALFGCLSGVHAFLAVNEPIAADTLVVEGWIPEYAIRDCAPIIRNGQYRSVFTIGGPVASAELPAPEDDTRAYVAATTLHHAGIDPRMVVMVPTTTVPRDRTYTCALTLKQWFSDRHFAAHGVNVVTLGPHARRSRLLFQKAFGPETAIGVIALPNREYDPAHWWRFSEGLKEVVSEAAAYVYARCFFSPSS